MAYSPRDAAIRTLLNSQGNPNATVQQDSIEVLQEVSFGDATYIFITYEGMDSRMGKVFCESMFQVKKNRLGLWAPSSSGSGCADQDPAKSGMMLTSGGTSSSGDGPGDPGFSSLYGRVFNDQIKTIQVTWQDGAADEVEVVNNSYVIFRQGLSNMKSLNGLNAEGESLHRIDREVAPEKEREMRQ